MPAGEACAKNGRRRSPRWHRALGREHGSATRIEAGCVGDLLADPAVRMMDGKAAGPPRSFDVRPAPVVTGGAP